MSVREIDEWVNRLSQEEMPILTRTANFISSIIARDSSSSTELARVILQDTPLTARVLRAANTIVFNPGGRKISTISRAVLNLGFDTVRTLSLSAALAEALLKASLVGQVHREMALAFHAAVQARKFASVRSVGSMEEVFIAGLLYRIGYIAFWCFGGELADRLDAALQKPGVNPVKVQKEVLGFRLHELSKRLVAEWKLSELLQQSYRGEGTTDPRMQCLALGYNLAMSTESGWKTPDVRKLLENASRFLRIPVEETTQIVYENALDAVAIAEAHGMNACGRLIPLPGAEPPKAPVEVAHQSSGHFPEPDHLVQLDILRELSAMLADRQMDLNLLFSILLEGIYRGIGMDRVLLALVTPDRGSLSGKHALGWEKEAVDGFNFRWNPQMRSVFNHVLENRKPVWVQNRRPAEVYRLLSDEEKAGIGATSFFMMPLLIRDRAVGIICADRKLSGRELDDESFTSFSYFSQQGNRCLVALAG